MKKLVFEVYQDSTKKTNISKILPHSFYISTWFRSWVVCNMKYQPFSYLLSLNSNWIRLSFEHPHNTKIIYLFSWQERGRFCYIMLLRVTNHQYQKLPNINEWCQPLRSMNDKLLYRGVHFYPYFLFLQFFTGFLPFFRLHFSFLLCIYDRIFKIFLWSLIKTRPSIFLHLVHFA